MLRRLCSSRVLQQVRLIYAENEQFHVIPMGKSDVQMQSRVSFLTKDMNDEKLVGIRGYSSVGFRLMDGAFLYGPIAAFPKTCLSWRVLTPDEITPESLELFFLLQPKIDILVVGVGDKEDLDAVRRRIAPAVAAHKIGLEIMPTEDAIPTFNFLNSEMRYVAAALYPPRNLVVTDEQYARALQHFRSYDEMDENPLLMGITNNLDYPIQDVVKRIWGEPRPDIVAEVQRAALKRSEEKAENIREIAAKRTLDELSLPDSKKELPGHNDKKELPQPDSRKEVQQPDYKKEFPQSDDKKPTNDK